MKKNLNKKSAQNKDPFLQRAIEYWLDSANELGYQPLFCELLISHGYVLKYSIKNTHFEQGKDVVAVSKTGIPHGYQLKGGSINLTRWRTEVKPEIDVLIESAIQHPDIDKGIPHISYLVTNGEIEDSVRSEIVALNEKRWKNTPLHTMTRGDLLSGFQEMAEGMLPRDAQTYKKLIDLIFADGTGRPDISRINSFLSEILNMENDLVKKNQRQRDIAAAMLYSTMIAGPYRRLGNHASVVTIMTLLLSSIFYIVDKYSIPDKYWLKTYQIIWSDIVETSELLESEINSNGFDSFFTSPLDVGLIPFRKSSAVSIIYSLKLSQFIVSDIKWKTLFDVSVIQKYKGSIVIWGEAGLLPFIYLGLISINNPLTLDSGIRIFETVINQIIENSGRASKTLSRLLSPYYDIDFIVRLTLGLEPEFEDVGKLNSHFLKPVIECLVHLNQREFLSKQWKEISFMRFDEFVPKNNVDIYLWRIKEGENRTVMPKAEKSWSELVLETKSFVGETLPATFKRFPEFLPFFLSVFPHRLTSETLALLYNTSSKTAKR